MDKEVLSDSRIRALRDEIDRLNSKTNTIVSDSKEEDLMVAMGKLTKTLGGFMELFQGAIDEMKIEEKEEELLRTEIRPIHEKLELIADQNEKIAQGLVTIAEMLTKEMSRQRSEHQFLAAPQRQAHQVQPQVGGTQSSLFQSYEQEQPSQPLSVPKPMPPPPPLRPKEE